jgi:hypothetical protein
LIPRALLFLKRWFFVGSLLLLLLVFLGNKKGGNTRSPLLALPGTQPVEIALADNAQVCKGCHYYVDSSHSILIHKDWSGSMMAQSARDPIFYAALVAFSKYRQGDGEFCIRCHSPTGWLAGRSEVFTGQVLAGSDLDGVQCDYCHRSVDPLNPDSTVKPLLFGPVPGYGNAMHVMETSDSIKRGPYDSAVVIDHKVKFDPFQESSNLCGVCHDISNPNHITPDERKYLPPYAYAPIERTYSEWFMSSYAQLGNSGTCQSCHMRDTSGYACKYFSLVKFRNDIAQHDLTGGNTFVPDILSDFYDSLDIDALQRGKTRSQAHLQQAADLSVVAYHSGDSILARVRITNLSGHKLPTGYPDGRRMWINLVATDLHHDTIFRTGAYDTSTAILQQDPHVKIYEMIQGLTNDTAANYGLTPGPSFYFFLSDTIFKDNRIPPKGFTNIGFIQRLAQPVASSYADSQYWDDTWYTLPATVTGVTVTLLYQTISKEYIEFLRDQNTGNPYDWNNWGSKLYASWQAHGKSQPVIMNSAYIPVKDSADAVHDDLNLPLVTRLLQNYPNPFNPSTTISFILRKKSHVSLKIYNVVGQEVATLLDGTKTSGSYFIRFDGSNLPSGVYLYRLIADNLSQTHKMILIK